VRAAFRRRALDQAEAIGGEDGDRGAVAGDRRRVGRAAVEQVPPALGAADRREQGPFGAVLIADEGLRPREGAAERDQVAAIGGAEGATREGEVESLEKVRLAGAVGADQADDPALHLDPHAGEATQGPCLD
jgi:hypothetical protein